MICPACSSVHTTVDFDEKMDLVHKCVECDHAWRADAKPKLDEIPSAPEQKTAALPKPQMSAPSQVTDRNIVKLARSRIRELNKEIHRLTALKRERDELTRLVAAAKQRGATDNVRRIRSAS